MGPYLGDPYVACQICKMAMLHVSGTINGLYPLLISRNCHVSFHSKFELPLMSLGPHVAMSILRNSHVTQPAGKMNLEFLENPSSTLLGYSRISN